MKNSKSGGSCVLTALAAGLLVLAAGARAKDLAPPASASTRAPTQEFAEPRESAADDLSRRATDPTNSPPSFGLINDVTTSYRNLADGTPIDETGYALRFQPVVPFKAWGTPNILRMTVPYQISGPDPEGLGDVTIFDLVIPPMAGHCSGNVRFVMSDPACHLTLQPPPREGDTIPQESTRSLHGPKE